MKQFRATKKQIYKACELLETLRAEFSCGALHFAAVAYIKDYVDMFEFRGYESAWPTKDLVLNRKFGVYKQDRILALLLYLEARDDL